MINNEAFRERLRSLDACPDAMLWLTEHDGQPLEDVFAAVPFSGWLLWFLLLDWVLEEHPEQTESLRELQMNICGDCCTCGPCLHDFGEQFEAQGGTVHELRDKYAWDGIERAITNMMMED